MTGGTARGVMVGRERVVDLDSADVMALLPNLWLVLVAMVMKMKK